MRIEKMAIDILKENKDDYNSWLEEFTSLSKCISKRGVDPDLFTQSYEYFSLPTILKYCHMSYLSFSIHRSSADSCSDSEDSSSGSDSSSIDSDSNLSEHNYEE